MYINLVASHSYANEFFGICYCLSSYSLQVGELFDVSESTAHAIVENLCEIIVKHLMPKFVHWPGPVEQRVIAESLEEMYRFPGIVGCIDCTHIKMNQPFQYAQDFVTRKQVFAINL